MYIATYLATVAENDITRSPSASDELTKAEDEWMALNEEMEAALAQ